MRHNRRKGLIKHVGSKRRIASIVKNFTTFITELLNSGVDPTLKNLN